MAFLGSWGWLILAALFVAACLLGKWLSGMRMVAGGCVVAAVILYGSAGFQVGSIEPPAALVFLAGLLAGEWGLILLVVLVIINFPLVEREHEGWAALILIGICVALSSALGFNLLGFLAHHPAEAAGYVLLYFCLGGGWSVFKWDRYNKRATQDLKQKLSTFISNWKTRLEHAPEGNDVYAWGHRTFGETWIFGKNDADIAAARVEMLAHLEQNEVPDGLLQEWHGYSDSQKPLLFEHKERILGWIAFWPWSALSYVFYDLLRDIAEWVWERLAGVYQRITDRHYADIDPRLVKKSYRSRS